MKEIERSDWIEFFPFAEPREEQVEAINFTLNSFLGTDKRLVCLDLATGVGKSAIGITVARYMDSLMGGGTYYLTSQKILQQQLMRDFTSHGMRTLKSADNYRCENGQTCAVTKRVARAIMRGTECSGTCPYNIDKKSFIEGSLGTTNYAYFMNETTYAGKLEPRNLLILDECHNAQSVLTSFSSLEISESINRSVLGRSRVRIPFGGSQSQVFDWIAEPFRKALASAKLKLARDLAKGLLKDNAERYERLDKYLCRVNRFVERYRAEDWVFSEDIGRNGPVLAFRPIRVDEVSKETLFARGKYVLMMSATVLNKDVFCRWIGLDPKDVAYMEKDCPFPIENRPVHFLPVGRMSKNEIDETLPKTVSILRNLLDLHKEEKGIIHCVSHKIARYIRDELKDPRILHRDDGDKDALLKEHAERNDFTVILSPSMTEGVDLVDDLSRFQVFVKVPFPNMGDAVVAKRMALDEKWYALETVRAMVQGAGRSIRNKDDRATTYVTDASFRYFFDKNKDMFPSSFRKSLK